MLYKFLKNNVLYQKRSINLIQQNKKDVDWQKPNDHSSIGESDIDIWYARLDPLLTSPQYLMDVLSADEKKWSEHFHFDKDKLRYVFSRGVLRLILSKYLEVAPAQIEIIIGPQGKPALLRQKKEYSIHFNLSHSYGAILYVVTRVGAIGVDVEKVREIPDIDNVIRQYSSFRERAAFNELSPTQKKQVFFNYWTRKEAFVKALGRGLSLPLDQFDVSILPDQPATLLSTHWNSLEVNNWLLSDIWLDASYAAAMAVNISRIGRHSEI